MLNWRKNIVTRKGVRWGYSLLRPLIKSGDRPDDPGPIVANSFPKSGTHLLIQIFQALPHIRDWGMFLPSHPSTRKNEVDPEILEKKLAGLARRELVAAHMYYSDTLEDCFSSTSASSFFIVRDLRDVVVSEAMYLRYMNRWHFMHRRFSRCSTDAEAIDLAIDGSSHPDDNYPNISRRFSRYRGWLDSEITFTVRYEDLMGSERDRVLLGIGQHLERAGHLPEGWSDDLFCSVAREKIQPSKSHTFRSGKKGKWREILSDRQVERIHELCERDLALLGYEV